MKKIIVLVLCALAVQITLGQTLPNSGFEQWVDHTTYMEPESWNTSNQITGFAGVMGVARSSDAYAGDYSVRLETVNLLNLITLPGAITFADFYVNIADSIFGMSGGISMHDRVTELKGMYKYTGVDNDSAAVLMYNYKRDGGIIDTIGHGYTYLHNANAWTSFTVNMQYQNNHIPDTLNVAIFSSGNSQELHVGSVLLVDSLVLHTYTGVINLSTHPVRMIAYPNPAQSDVTIKAGSAHKDRRLFLYDLSGKLLSTFPFETQQITLNIQKFHSGTYLFKVMQNNGWVGSGRFVKK